MYVCICHGVSEEDIKQAIGQGANTLLHLREELKVSTCCGTCAEYAQECLERNLHQTRADTYVITA